MVSGEMELVYDKPESIASTLGQAFYRIFSHNLADNLHNGTPLPGAISPGEHGYSRSHTAL